MTTDPRETQAAQERAVEGRERLGRGIGKFWVALAVAVVVGVALVIVVFAM